MKKPAKILLGIATVWPFIYMALFLGFIFSTLWLAGGAYGETMLRILFSIIIPLNIMMVWWVVALIAFYMVNVFKNDRVDKDKKMLWAVGLLIANIIAMPIYWYRYLWRDNGGQSSTSNERKELNNGESYDWARRATSNQREGEYSPPPQPPNWRD